MKAAFAEVARRREKATLMYFIVDDLGGIVLDDRG
jgi:hypothetical protein